MKSTAILAFLLLIIGNAFPTNCQSQNTMSKDSIVITFGSCSNQDKEQRLWDDILMEKSDVWIWLGDNIYGDSEDMSVLKKKYAQQKAHPVYQRIRQSTTILGTWDDHDYGANDAGKEYPMKAASQQLFLDFLDVPKEDARRKRAGVYSSHLLEKNGIQVKILLLDTRYFRDPLKKKEKSNIANWEGEILGTDQWDWLAAELKNSTADVHIIGSSIQVLPEEHRFEKWTNFPLEQQKLLNLLVQLDVKHPIFLSGDRHIGEISKKVWLGKSVYECTSSSLTHGWSERRKEANRFRIGSLIYNENYGRIKITKTDTIQIQLSLLSDGQQKEMEVGF